MYLSFLSTVKIIMPHGIYIHCDIQPHGIFWDKIMSVKGVVFVEYGPTHFIFGKRITRVQHESDVIRTDILYRYGGVYIDWDAFWLKPIDNLLTSGYEFIVAFDHGDRDPFPDSINLGIVLATPGASFLKRLEQSFKYYRGDHITYHAVEGVYKLYEEVPELVQIEPRLQVMCYRLKCHPLWLPDYKNISSHHTFDWTRDAYAIHFTSPLPPEFTNEKLLRASNETFFGKIGNHVLNYN
ncbi:hypothetical protein CHS0354_039468 [Potamilus streckersoni]|uniref:Glycosyltransferase n=1 Tax=Potamilus streckersoni TaxID=2493646 RepID=A0AAE0S1S2_9BIVA|nr:hypothetical protein CHS0354_039468 [Potamilus streckersoni]